MISNIKKLNFCNFFPHFPLLVRPHSFSLLGAFFAHDIPHQNPLHFSHLSSLSGGTLRSHILPTNFPASFLVFSLLERPTDRICTKTRRFRSKLKPFLGESSPTQGRREGDIRGEIGRFPFKESLRKGLKWGCLGDGNKEFLHEGYP